MIITVVLVVLVLAAVGYVLVSRMTGQPVNTRRLLVLHAVLTAIGALQLAGARVRRVPALDAVLLAVGLLAAAGLGVARGATVAVFGRDGGALAAVPTGGRRRRVDHSMAPHLKAAVIPSPPRRVVGSTCRCVVDNQSGGRGRASLFCGIDRSHTGPAG